MHPSTASREPQQSRWRRFFTNGRALGLAGLVLTCLPILPFAGAAVYMLISAEYRGYVPLYGIGAALILVPLAVPITVNLVAISLGPTAVRCGKAGLVLGVLGVLYVTALLYVLN